jgi:hypothetical protein
MNNTNNNGTAAAKKVRIYQIKFESKFLFKEYAFIKRERCTAPFGELYRVVFDGQLETDNLDDIFHIFNLKHPLRYKGRSLSVSDIVELYDDKGSIFFYCDLIGFEQIKFKPVKYQYMLLTQNGRDLMNIQIFPNIMEAQSIMEAELLKTLDGSFDNYSKDDDYGYDEISAWSDPDGNWDWTISELSFNKILNIKTDFVRKDY